MLRFTHQKLFIRSLDWHWFRVHKIDETKRRKRYAVIVLYIK